MRRIILFLIWIVCALPAAAHSGEFGRQVVVVVWDGMRPDFVTGKQTPALWKLASNGVTFRSHHAVFPSATMVNGTALVTGGYPDRNGILANYEYRPDLNRRRAINVENPAVVKKGDELSRGKYVALATIAELVQRAGGHSIIASAKTVGLLLNRRPPVNAAANGVTLFAGKSVLADAATPLITALGPFPIAASDKDVWTTKALTDFLWKDGVPAFSLLWLANPDLTQHEFAPGAPAALAAIKSCDEKLAAVLSALARKGVRDTTDLFVVSDHGFSTISRSVDLRKILSDAGFKVKTEFENGPQPGEIMLAGNGGSVLFYVVEHDATVTRRLVEFLQQSDFAGVIFTRQPMQGTFALEAANIANAHAADIVMAFRWNDSKNQFGIAGMIDADWQRPAGQGTHATLSRFDMHNTLIASGPDFRHGAVDDLPTGNVDLAPTILHILGINAPQKMDGRVLSEAMVNVDQALAKKMEATTITAEKDFATGSWRQSLRISRVGPTIYLDEGNGAFAPKCGRKQ